MSYNPAIHHRRSIRLKDYNYSQEGAYFITICTHNRACLFGEINNSPQRGTKFCAPAHDCFFPTDGGKIAEQYWLAIPKHFPHIVLDEYTIMPNHVHGILIMNVGVRNFGFLPKNKFQKIIPRSIGSIIRGYKIGVTKWFRQNAQHGLVWQRSFYEQVIRNERHLHALREYVRNNRFNWSKDGENLLVE